MAHVDPATLAFAVSSLVIAGASRYPELTARHSPEVLRRLAAETLLDDWRSRRASGQPDRERSL